MNVSLEVIGDEDEVNSFLLDEVSQRLVVKSVVKTIIELVIICCGDEVILGGLPWDVAPLFSPEMSGFGVFVISGSSLLPSLEGREDFESAEIKIIKSAHECHKKSSS